MRPRPDRFTIPVEGRTFPAVVEKNNEGQILIKSTNDGRVALSYANNKRGYALARSIAFAILELTEKDDAAEGS